MAPDLTDDVSCRMLRDTIDKCDLPSESFYGISFWKTLHCIVASLHEDVWLRNLN